VASCAWSWTLTALADQDLHTLLQQAARSIWHGHRHGARLPFDVREFSWGVRQPGFSFVGLTLDGDNVGCQGNTEPRVLLLSVVTNAFNAAFRDSRFGALTDWGMRNAQLTVYHLHDAQTLHGVTHRQVADEICPEHSLQVSMEQHTGTLLSTMQSRFRSAESFIDAALDKANLHQRCNYQEVRYTLYRTQVLGPVPLADHDL